MCLNFHHHPSWLVKIYFRHSVCLACLTLFEAFSRAPDRMISHSYVHVHCNNNFEHETLDLISKEAQGVVFVWHKGRHPVTDNNGVSLVYVVHWKRDLPRQVTWSVTWIPHLSSWQGLEKIRLCVTCLKVKQVFNSSSYIIFLNHFVTFDAVPKCKIS